MKFKGLLILAFSLLAGTAMLSFPYFAVAVIAAVVVLILYTKNALWGIAIALLALAPMASFFAAGSRGSQSVSEISSAISEGDPLRRVTISLLLVVGLGLLLVRRRSLSQVNLKIPTSIYVALAVISLLWSQEPELTARRSLVAVAVITFAAGIACAYLGRQRQGHVLLIRVVCWGAFIACALVLGSAVYRGDFHPFSIAWRLGTLNHENQTCQVAAVGLLAALVTRSNKEIWPNRAELFVLTAIPALVVLLTKSRTTWLGLAAGLIFTELYRRRTFIKTLAFLVMVVVLLGGLIYSSPFQGLWSRGESRVVLESASGRTELWSRIWPEVRKRLWLGYGFGAFWSPKTVRAEHTEWAPTSAHNGYLDAVDELGIVGLAAVLSIVLLSIRNAWRLKRYCDTGMYLLGLSIAILVMDAGESLFHDIEFYPMIVYLLVSFFVSYRLAILAREKKTAQEVSGYAVAGR